MENMVKNFWQGRRVFLTGHTGFKGSWLARILTSAGAELTGYALAPTEPSLFAMLDIPMTSIIGDIRDFSALLAAFKQANPEVVIHMAAQPLVRESYQNPTYTYEVNVMGTVNLLECARLADGVQSIVNVTTDKVYKNHEWEWGYRETDELGGFDPYSNSKSCSELVTQSYINAFLGGKTAVSTVRAGNVIGGGDFAKDRIVPDCVRAAAAGEVIQIRNPQSIRPFQHVLEPLFAYLTVAERQAENGELAGFYNIGPDYADCVSSAEIAELFCKYWGNGQKWENLAQKDQPHEANFLKLDCSKMRRVFGWQPRLDIATAVKMTVDWTKSHLQGENAAELMDRQILEYLEEKNDRTTSKSGNLGESCGILRHIPQKSGV
ncbi:MAG: CDP-glucose 4,6-dehydratase [Turicibacter sp.]|nr:CDP-glucose 4,6-dehydratase [Turicibacter sp.]